eukprot:3771586-Alexandrium_andersonii.AAC.1
MARPEERGAPAASPRGPQRDPQAESRDSDRTGMQAWIADAALLCTRIARADRELRDSVMNAAT